jgi:Protein of unknown function (DUF1036)
MSGRRNLLPPARIGFLRTGRHGFEIRVLDREQRISKAHRLPLFKYGGKLGHSTGFCLLLITGRYNMVRGIRDRRWGSSLLARGTLPITLGWISVAVITLLLGLSSRAIGAERGAILGLWGCNKTAAEARIVVGEHYRGRRFNGHISPPRWVYRPSDSFMPLSPGSCRVLVSHISSSRDYYYYAYSSERFWEGGSNAPQFCANAAAQEGRVMFLNAEECAAADIRTHGWVRIQWKGRAPKRFTFNLQ